MARKGRYTYDYPRPALTVDAVVFGVDLGVLKVLLIRRGIEPFSGMWAIPGGFVRMNESTEQAVARELKEETGLKNIFLEQLYTFSDPKRDPRERVVSVSYFALVSPAELKVVAGSDAAEVGWFPVHTDRYDAAALEVPLAFDHVQILQVALARLRAKVRYQPVGFELLPRDFTLGELQVLYEAILGRPLDKRNFRRKVLAQGILQEQGKAKHQAYRPPMLYRFDSSAYVRLRKSGFNFEL